MVKGRRVIESRSAELVVLMGELKRLHDDLLSVIQQKLNAIRRADTEGISSCLARERFLVDRIRQQEGLRQQLVQIISKEMGSGATQPGAMSLSDLALQLAEPRRGQLLALRAGLRETLLEIDRRNKVAVLVTAEMLKHFRQVCAAMAKVGRSGGTYSPAGQLDSGQLPSVFEAVG